MGLVKLNDRGVRNATTFGSLNTGSMIFISKFTSDGSDDTATFASGIDSTYKEYLFIYNNIHPETDDTSFQVGFRDGSTAYDATKTTTFFMVQHTEADATQIEYETAHDLAQGTGFLELARSVGSDNDQAVSGYLHLFNPSSTTFVKHFIARGNSIFPGDKSEDAYVAGYCNVTAAIDGVQFKMSADEIQGGTISLYGIK